MVIFSIMPAFVGSTSHRHRKTLPQIVRISSRQTAEGPRGLSQLLSLWLSLHQQRISFARTCSSPVADRRSLTENTVLPFIQDSPNESRTGVDGSNFLDWPEA